MVALDQVEAVAADENLAKLVHLQQIALLAVIPQTPGREPRIVLKVQDLEIS